MCENYRNLNVLVLGSGISGLGAEKLLNKLGANVFLYDEAVDKILLTERFVEQFDLCVISPSIDLKHKIYKVCKKEKVEVISEVELASRNFSGLIVGITGTNGKTTVTKLLECILKEGSLNAKACGNVGYSFSECVAVDNPNIAVVELSSFQLEQMCDGGKLRPHIAMITNISPDHLDRHGNMDIYAKAKKNIAKNQTTEDYLLLSSDDIASEYLAGFNPKSKVEFVSVENKVDGAYLFGDKLCYYGEEVCSIDDIALKGQHNVANALFCLATAKILGVDNDAIVSGLGKYGGEPHRIVFCSEVFGKRFFNDSKGTNIGATIAATKSMKGNTVLIVGGKDKGYDFDNLFLRLPKNIVKVLAIGETAEKLFASAIRAGFVNIEIARSLERAIKMSLDIETDNVLLSPACSSFDSYKDYKDRGEEFERIVKELQTTTDKTTN
ncbi:MAG: UDP-N-acetylmuramoyl-L-alanine--D-glutamate ligase [Firmicutes bacterium]|nr:UDP-N-acetylmuramoyl-L-alanine--D-glutamate ligase [Bacillota bacterium]